MKVSPHIKIALQALALRIDPSFSREIEVTSDASGDVEVTRTKVYIHPSLIEGNLDLLGLMNRCVKLSKHFDTLQRRATERVKEDAVSGLRGSIRSLLSIGERDLLIDILAEELRLDLGGEEE